MTAAPPSRAATIGLVALVLAASVAGLANGFAYDDLPMIVGNARVHDLHAIGRLFTGSYWSPHWGAALYRPLTTTLFTLEWAVGRGSPVVFHGVSIALYVAVTLAVYALAGRVLAPGPAWLAAALFAVHPVHVEAVANAVGQSELLAALGVVVAVAYYLKRRCAAPDAPLAPRDLALLAGCYGAACVAKEHAIVLPALLLAAEATVVPDRRAWSRRWTTLWPAALTLAIVGGGYLVARTVILHGFIGEPAAVPLGRVAWGVRWWTMLGVVPEWARLFVWPAHLAAIYSPPGTPVRESVDAGAVIGLALAAASLCLGIVLRRRLPAAALGIWWIAVAILPVSNLLVPSAVLLAERTLFLPSVGAVILLGAAAQVIAARVRGHGSVAYHLAAAAAACVLAAGIWRSAARQLVWHDTHRLIAQSVQDEPLSYRAHFTLMGELFDAGQWGSAEREGRIAIRLYSGDPWVYEMLALHYFLAGQCQLAEPLVRRTLVLDPHYADARFMQAECRKRDLAAGAGEGERHVMVRIDWRQWAPISIGLVAVLCYANALQNGFALDDNGIIASNASVHSLSALWRAFANPYWPDGNGGQYRPLAIASFALDWALSRGHPWWFHAVNIGLHVAVCLLLWRVLLTMLPPLGAWFGAFLFAVHPVHVEAISNVVGRLELLMTAFVLAAWLAHRRRHGSAVLWYALALLSKETGIVFLALAVCHDLLFDGPPREAFASRRKLYDGYALVTAVYLGVLVLLFRHQHFVVPAPTWTGATVGQRILTMLRVFPECARLFLAPVELKIDYTPRVIDLQTTVTPAIVLGAGLLVAALAAIPLAWRRAPAVAFGILAFFVAMSPVSNILFPTGVVLAERTLYLPSIGIAAVGGWLFPRAMAVRPRTVGVLAAALCLGFVVRAWIRTPVWRGSKELLLTQMREQPESYRAHQTAGNIYLLSNQWASADSAYRATRRLFTRDPGPYFGGAESALMLGEYDAAGVLLDSAIRLDPRGPWGYLRLADVRLAQGNWPSVMGNALAAYLLAPDSLRAVDLVASAAQRLHNFASAEAIYRRALADHPHDRHLRQGYANMLRDRGDSAAAQRQLELAGIASVSALLRP